MAALMKAGADPIAHMTGKTGTHPCTRRWCLFKRLEAVKVLLQAGAPADAKDSVVDATAHPVAQRHLR